MTFRSVVSSRAAKGSTQAPKNSDKQSKSQRHMTNAGALNRFTHEPSLWNNNSDFILKTTTICLVW